jgi:probable F420-dependent oxidoreductase
MLPRFKRQFITDPVWVRSFIETIESAGVESVWGVEHVVVAVDYEPLYPYSESGRMGDHPDTVMPDPLEWLAFVAACSTTLRLGTAVLILTQHSPVTMAKRVATLDALSGGRTMLGVGIGWQKEEYAALNVPYADRGRRLDEYIDVLRALWGAEVASHSGRYVSFSGLRSDPKPAQPGGVPIVIGGSSVPAARRAGLRGDGWLPFVISPDEFGARAEELRAVAVAAGRDPASVTLSAWPTSWRWGATFDVALAQAYVDAGATRLMITAEEASGESTDDIRRLVGEYQERVISNLVRSGG